MQQRIINSEQKKNMQEQVGYEDESVSGVAQIRNRKQGVVNGEWSHWRYEFKATEWSTHSLSFRHWGVGSNYLFL